jgi:hypothetical protein
MIEKVKIFGIWVGCWGLVDPAHLRGRASLRRSFDRSAIPVQHGVPGMPVIGQCPNSVFYWHPLPDRQPLTVLRSDCGSWHSLDRPPSSRIQSKARRAALLHPTLIVGVDAAEAPSSISSATLAGTERVTKSMRSSQYAPLKPRSSTPAQVRPSAILQCSNAHRYRASGCRSQRRTVPNAPAVRGSR